MGNPILQVTPASLGLSGATEAGVSATQGASTGAGAAALLGILPMVPDPTSMAFAEALRAAGAAYVAAMTEHSVQRGLFAGAQGVMAATFETTEAARTAAAAIGTVL